MRHKLRSPNQKKGAILILLLGLLFATALMVTSFVQTALNELRFSNQNLADEVLRPHAESALQVVLATLNEYRVANQPIHFITKAMNTACEHPGLQFPKSLKIDVTIEDCAAKIGLNLLKNQSQWESLLDPLEISVFEKANMIDATLDWIDSDEIERPYGAEKPYYRSIEREQFPPNRAIRRLQEFYSIKGFVQDSEMTESDNDKLFNLLFNTLSPHHASPPNLNTAEQAVLNYVTEDPSESLAILDYRYGPDGKPNTSDDRALISRNDLLRFGIQTKQAYRLNAGPFIVRIRIKDAARTFFLAAFLSTDKSSSSSLLRIEHTSEYLKF